MKTISFLVVNLFAFSLSSAWAMELGENNVPHAQQRVSADVSLGGQEAVPVCPGPNAAGNLRMPKSEFEMERAAAQHRKGDTAVDILPDPATCPTCLTCVPSAGPGPTGMPSRELSAGASYFLDLGTFG